MKKLLLLCMSLWLVAADFEWVPYEKALKLAKKEHKPIMIMITQKHCPVCSYMEDVTFEDIDLSEYIEDHLIPVKLNLHQAAMHGFTAYGTPTFYFLSSDGKPLTRPFAGGTNAKNFMKKLKEILR